MNDRNDELRVDSGSGKALYRKKRFIIPVTLLIIIAALVAIYWFMFLRGYVSTDDAYIDGDPITISSKILGRVASLAADEGDSVGQGQILVQLDSSDLKAQEAQAIAGLEYARQNVPLASINLNRSQDDFQRALIQFKDNIITREQYDHARKALDMAQAQHDVALSQVNSSKAQLEVIRTQLKNAHVVSPRSGIVARKWVMPGDIVQAGQPIFTVYDLKDIWITANFEETKIASILPGLSVQVSVDAYPGEKYEGKVLLIGTAAASQFSLIPPNNASGNFTKVTQRIPVKIDLFKLDSNKTQQPGRLLPGMSVVVRVSIKEH
jgi:membrane fusion protein (multidrug efflux system)